MSSNSTSLAQLGTEEEKGRFRDDYFSPVKIPVIEHVPWTDRLYPSSLVF